MRKVTVILDPEIVRRVLPRKYRPFFDMIEHVEVLHILQIDPARGVKVVIAELELRPGHRIEELGSIGGVKILDVLKQAGDCYTVLVKAEGDRRLKRMARLFPLDVSYQLPFRYDQEKLVMSFVAEQKTIGLVLKALKFFGKIVDVHVQKALFSDSDPVSLLTGKQKEALLAAKRLGYYDIPRKAGTSKVARELDLSKSTTLEHLRKAERRLMVHLLSWR